MGEITQIKISDEWLDDYKKTAIKYQKELLELPIRQAQDVLKYMRGITGLRGKTRFKSIEGKSEFGPYNPDRQSAASVNIDFRELETQFGSVIEKFHPNDYALLTMGYDQPTLGEGQNQASTTLLVLSQIAKARGEALANAVFNGKRNAEGDKTIDLFDGFNTIAEAEITAGTIAEGKNNLITIAEKITNVNAVDITKQIVFSLDEHLRRIPCNFFCSQDLVDKYNEAYLESHHGISYNKEYNQPYVEGSNNLITFVPLAELAGSDKFYVTPKNNMLWGTDNKSAMSTIDVSRFEPFRLTFSSTIFFGVNFHTVDARRLKVVKLTNQA